MHKLLFYLVTLVFFNTIFAQTYFSSIPFSVALKRSADEGKIIFLQFEAADCQQCNEVAEKGLSDKDLAEHVANTFVLIRVSKDHPERNEIATRYNIKTESGFGSLFIDRNGTLLHKFLASTTNSKDYYKHIDLAINKAGESFKINELEKEYEGGNKSLGFLEHLLLNKKTLNLPTDKLLEEYVALLPADSLKSIRTISFIMQMRPMLGSPAYEAVRKDNALFNRAWFTMNLSTRIGINNAIIYKAINKAITEKDEAFALRTAKFAQGTNTNYEAGAKAYDKNMMQFYKETGDSSKYFMKAIAYYERYFMVVNADSIKKIDSTIRRKLLDQQPRQTRDTIINGKKATMQTASIAFKPTTQNFTMELNEGAWNFYKMTNNPYLLSIATEWAKKGLDIYESPEALDTYAKLLYKQGQKEKAIDTETNAIALRKQRGYNTKDYEAIVEKMKKGAVIKD